VVISAVAPAGSNAFGRKVGIIESTGGKAGMSGCFRGPIKLRQKLCYIVSYPPASASKNHDGQIPESPNLDGCADLRLFVDEQRYGN